MFLPAKTELLVDIADGRFPSPGIAVYTGPDGMTESEVRAEVNRAYRDVIAKHGLTLTDVTPDLKFWRVLVSFAKA